MDRLDYESEIINILNEASSKLNSQEFETLLTRVEWILYYYK